MQSCASCACSSAHLRSPTTTMRSLLAAARWRSVSDVLYVWPGSPVHEARRVHGWTSMPHRLLHAGATDPVLTDDTELQREWGAAWPTAAPCDSSTRDLNA